MKIKLVAAAALAAAFVVSAWSPVVAPASAHPGDLSGVLKSTDGGQHWTYLSMGLVVDTVFALVIDPTQPTVMYAGTDRGLYRSRDGGVEWDRQTQGIDGEKVYSLALDPERPGALYAGADTGLFWSSDGAAWQQVGKGTANGPLFAVLADSRRPGTVYVAGEQSILRSSDRGARWAAASAGLPAGRILYLAAAGQEPTTLYAATSQGPFVTTNEGREWKPAATGLPGEGVFYVTASRHNTARLYTSVRDRIYSRLSTGSDWQEASPPLTCDAFPGRTWVLRLAERRRDSQLLYAGSERGLLLSSDGGATWSCPPPFDYTWVQVGAIVFDPNDPATVYAGTSGPPYRNHLVPSDLDSGDLPKPVTARSAGDWLPALLVLALFVAGSGLLLRLLVRRYRAPARTGKSVKK